MTAGWLADRVVQAKKGGRWAEAYTGRKLRGVLEVDETYIGGLEENKHSDKRLVTLQRLAVEPMVFWRLRGCWTGARCVPFAPRLLMDPAS